MLSAFLLAPAMAQDVVGSGVAAGRAVELMSDGTWRAVPDTPEGCRPVVGPLAFCSGPPAFVPADDLEAGSPIDAQWRAGDGRFAQILHATRGSRDGMTVGGLRSAVIDNAARFAEVDPARIAVLAEVPALLDGVLGTTLVYAVPLDGTSFLFQNTLLLLPTDHAQVMTFAVGAGPDPDMASLHQRFLDEIRVERPGP